MAKVGLSLCVSLCATVLLAYVAFRASSPSIASDPQNKPWTQGSMQFVTWNKKQWTAWIRGELFELVPEEEANWHRHSNPSLAFVDWSGEPWQAKIDGQAFLLAHRGDWNGDTQRVTALRYRDWQGNNQLRTVSQLQR